MRRRKMFLTVQMMILLCLLCACGGKGNDPIQAAMDFRTALLAHGGCGFELEAQAETEAGVWELRLDCALDPAGNGTVTVLAPDSIAGITARTTDGGPSLRYEDLALGLGLLPGTELAPAAAPGRLVRAWGQDWIASAGREEGALLFCCQDGDLEVRTWLGADGLPLRAELLQQGRSCFSGTINNFQWKAVEQHETTEEDLG